MVEEAAPLARSKSLPAFRATQSIDSMELYGESWVLSQFVRGQDWNRVSDAEVSGGIMSYQLDDLRPSSQKPSSFMEELKEQALSFRTFLLLAAIACFLLGLGLGVVLS